MKTQNDPQPPQTISDVCGEPPGSFQAMLDEMLAQHKEQEAQAKARISASLRDAYTGYLERTLRMRVLENLHLQQEVEIARGERTPDYHGIAMKYIGIGGGAAIGLSLVYLIIRGILA